MPELKTDVTVSGPLFDGRALKALVAFTDEAEREVAQTAVNEIQARLGTVLENPTGNYRSNIVTDRVQDDSVVTDSGVIYGAWLEGVSSRNKKSRFKGYATFRKTRQALQNKAASIAETRLGPFLKQMGGR